MSFHNRQVAIWLRVFLGTVCCLPAFSACVRARGPGSTRDAESFCKRRLADLAADSIRQTPDGKWLFEKFEVRNADYQITSQAGAVTAKVVYEYRAHRSSEFPTRGEAAAAIALPIGTDFTAVKEDYDFRDGEWVLRR